MTTTLKMTYCIWFSQLIKGFSGFTKQLDTSGEEMPKRSTVRTCRHLVYEGCFNNTGTISVSTEYN